MKMGLDLYHLEMGEKTIVKYCMFTSKLTKYVSCYVDNDLFVIIREITAQFFRQI